LTPDVLADDYLARVDRGFDPRGRIDTISVEISICVHSNVTDMNTDAQLVRATSFGRLFSVLLTQRGCGAHCHFCAWKFGEKCIAEEFHHSTFVAGDDTARERLQDFN
jgi:hypothetical protein